MKITFLGTGAADWNWTDFPPGTRGSSATLLGTHCLIDAGPTVLRRLADAGVSPARIKDIFELFADEDAYPIYFHCNIGTDRTGCIGYLLGAYLGMSEEDLYVNYVFSNFGSISGGAMGAGRSSSSITGETGYGSTVKSYPGDTLSEQAANALKDICGISQETLDKIREILVVYYE